MPWLKAIFANNIDAKKYFVLCSVPVTPYRNCEGINQDVSKDVGATICEAFAAYSDGEFAKAVDLLNPVRFKVLRIGGSNAQVSVSGHVGRDKLS